MIEPSLPTLRVEATWLPPSIPDGDFWAVLAYHHRGWWKLFDSLWESELVARDEARRLPACWIGRVVVHIRIPVERP